MEISYLYFDRCDSRFLIFLHINGTCIKYATRTLGGCAEILTDEPLQNRLNCIRIVSAQHFKTENVLISWVPIICKTCYGDYRQYDESQCFNEARMYEANKQEIHVYKFCNLKDINNKSRSCRNIMRNNISHIALY